MLKDDIGSFPEFSKAVLSSLAHEVMTDPDLFVLTLSGLCLGSQSRPLKGLGIALGGWYASRRADQYVSVIDSKLRMLSQVIGASNSSEEANGH